MENTYTLYTNGTLRSYCREAASYPKRAIFNNLIHCLSDTSEKNISVLYGLRFTGKSTLMKQAAEYIGGDDTAYIRFNNEYTDFIRIIQEIKDLINTGKRYIFLDEITILKELPYLLKEINELQNKNCKFILSGTDSLAFYLLREELYESADFIHTTFVPFSEFSQIYKEQYDEDITIDEYIKRSGIFKNLLVNTAVLPKNYQGDIVREYEYTAIARNIQNSIGKVYGGSKLDILERLYHEDKLTHAIMKVVQQEKHSFFKKSIASAYSLEDINKAVGILSRSVPLPKNVKKDLQTAIEKKLGMWADGFTIQANQDEMERIEFYLYKIEMLSNSSVYVYNNTKSKFEKKTEKIITQPGLRYTQIKALLDSIEEIIPLEENVRDEIINRVYADCVGMLFEECIRYNTYYELQNTENEVFKIQSYSLDGSGEIDLAVHNNEENYIDLFEIKHGQRPSKSWVYNFNNSAFMSIINENIAPIRNRAIIYNGPDNKANDDNYISLLNVNNFLHRISQSNYNDIRLIPDTPEEEIHSKLK